MDNRVDQYCENIVMSSLVSFQGNRGATIRNHVLVCLRTGLAERTEWIRCFPPSEQVCCGRQLLYQCFSGEIEQRTSKFVDFFRPPCYCRSIQMFIHCSNDLALGFKRDNVAETGSGMFLAQFFNCSCSTCVAFDESING